MAAHTRSQRIAGLVLPIAAVGLIAAGVAYAQLTQVAVLTGTADQGVVAAHGNTLAWAQNSASNSGTANLYVRVGSSPVRRVNPAGTAAWPGSFSGDRLIFQQDAKGQSDLRFYNVVTHTFGIVPAGWNTKSWEWEPTISGHYVLFGRETAATRRDVIYLGDLTTGHLRLLASLTGSDIYLEPGEVNGNWATWASCPNDSVACDVYEYNIANQTTSKVSNTFASGKWQYAPSVSSTGTVYFIHSDTGCGAHVTLNKRPIGGTRTVLVSFAAGYDIGYGSTYTDDSSGTPVVYYPRYNCAAKQADIYKVADK